MGGTGRRCDPYAHHNQDICKKTGKNFSFASPSRQIKIATPTPPHDLVDRVGTANQHNATVHGIWPREAMDRTNPHPPHSFERLPRQMPTSYSASQNACYDSQRQNNGPVTENQAINSTGNHGTNFNINPQPGAITNIHIYNFNMTPKDEQSSGGASPWRHQRHGMNTEPEPPADALSSGQQHQGKSAKLESPLLRGSALAQPEHPPQSIVTSPVLDKSKCILCALSIFSFMVAVGAIHRTV